VERQPRDHIVRVGTREPEYTGAQGGSEEGTASWFRSPRGGMVAAHRTLPFGTVVKVTNLDNGKSVNVTIVDRGPFVDGRIIDLHTEAFERVAPMGQGVFNARIEY
jgi:rare lipoprotein A